MRRVRITLRARPCGDGTVLDSVDALAVVPKKKLMTSSCLCSISSVGLRLRRLHRVSRVAPLEAVAAVLDDHLPRSGRNVVAVEHAEVGEQAAVQPDGVDVDVDAVCSAVVVEIPDGDLVVDGAAAAYVKVIAAVVAVVALDVAADIHDAGQEAVQAEHMIGAVGDVMEVLAVDDNYPDAQQVVVDRSS